jgi:acyl-[acyl-carrier-protein]-phospholipid O-acyltransferase/long-chain-fatty-acid--[acyl-carrier-protein] ligase
LIVFYTRQDVSPATLWERLGDTALPKLWIPKREHILQIEAIPTLGTGKIDLQALRRLAQKL